MTVAWMIPQNTVPDSTKQEAKVKVILQQATKVQR